LSLKPIFWISGPPASGKTTLTRALLARFDRAMHIPMDDVRGWVVEGMADSVPWSDETEAQFRIAEDAACDVALRYQAAGFAAAVDHCRNPKRLEELIQVRLQGVPVVKVCLMPTLDVNLERSHTRTNKTFDPHMLDETIVFTNTHYREDVPAGWLVINNTHISVAETVDFILTSPGDV